MKEGDFLICKKTYCEKFFQLPLTIFKKGKKYKLCKIYSIEVSLYLTPGGGYTKTYIKDTPISKISIKEYLIKCEFGTRRIGEDVFFKTFYNLREERKLKLEKIKNDRYVI